MPVLFLSGTADHLVPPAMMAELYRACGSERKHLAKFPGGTHNETWSCAHYYHTIIYFMEEVAHVTISFVGGAANGSSARRTHPPPPTLVTNSGHVV